MATPDTRDADTNPFRSPLATASDDEAQPLHVPITEALASRGRRFANLLLDQVFAYLAGILLGIAAVMLGAEKTLQSIPDFLLGIFIMLVYFIPQESLFGRTLAKFITGTRVVRPDGTSPSLGQVVGRTFARLIPFEAFSFLGHPAVGWHDSLS